MENDYTLYYPELSQDGKDRTKVIIDKFKDQLTKVFNDTMYDFTRNLAEEIVDDDSWIELRSSTMKALCQYGDGKDRSAGSYLGQNWITIRRKILEENKEEIVNYIIKDKDYEIQTLKDQIKTLEEFRRY